MKTMYQILIVFLVISYAEFISANTSSYSNTIKHVLNHQDRPQADKDRDTARKPEAIIELLDIRPGMKVVDYAAGGGYYSEIFARLLNNQGHLFSIKGQLKTRKLSKFNNITVLPSLDLSDLNEPVDRIFTALNYHDLVNKKELDRSKLLKTIYARLNNDGYLMVIDHNASPGAMDADTKKKHRIESAFVLNEIQRAGFVLDRASSILSNADDNYNLDVWQSSTKGKTDRFVFRFKKQTAGRQQ